jgi:F-type H+-transporting ATPase subunit delta
VRERIRGYADASLENATSGERRWLRRGPTGATALAPVAEELAGVVSLIEGSDDLRGALEDPGVATPARRALLQDLLGGRVRPVTLQLLIYAAEADRPTAFPSDVAWLARRVAAERDGMHTVPRPLGREGAKERVEGYASALLEGVRDEHRLNELEDELFRFARVVEGSEQLSAALAEGDLPVEVRHQLVVDLLSTKATEETTRLAGYATQVARPRDFLILLDFLVERVASETNRRIAEVVCAVPVSEEQRLRLADALARLVGYPVDVRIETDPSLLGGFVATIGDTVVDGSVRHRLTQLKERLVLPEAVAPAEGEAR